MTKRFFKKAALGAMAAALTLLAASASAEQARAADYRAMVASGRFCVGYCTVRVYADPKIQKKYGDKFQKATREVFIADGERRALFSVGGRNGNDMAIRMENRSPVGKLFRNAARSALSDGDKLKPDLMLSGGNYYQFFGKNKALMIPAEEAEDDRTDPRAGWKSVMRSLGAPGFLPAFVTDEAGETAASFLESGSEEVLGEVMAFDKYVMKLPESPAARDISGAAPGAEGRRLAYKYYYDKNGNLSYVKVSAESGAGAVNADAKAKNSDAYIKIERFDGEAAKESFEIPADCKVYYIEPGSMNDLFGYGEPVEAGRERV